MNPGTYAVYNGHFARIPDHSVWSVPLLLWIMVGVILFGIIMVIENGI